MKEKSAAKKEIKRHLSLSMEKGQLNHDQVCRKAHGF
jgi:hypothetical protein